MKSSILIHTGELNSKWINRMAAQKVDILGIHPEGGKDAADTARILVEQTRDPEFRALIDLAADKGLEIEYELHAASYLLPRDLFETHPEYFRMDEEGNRTPKQNFCVSCDEAMDLVAKNAVKLAQSLYRSRPYYYFWMDDARTATCHCEKCRKLSPADQYLLYVNRIARELKAVDPEAKVCYLGYYEFLHLPTTVKPEENVFLEFAPIDKYLKKEFEEIEQRMMMPLVEFFGTDDAKVLEYWLDNSLFSKWKKPPAPFSADPDTVRADVDAYREAGFENIATFGCFLGEDYEALYGEPDITPFTKAF